MSSNQKYKKVAILGLILASVGLTLKTLDHSINTRFRAALFASLLLFTQQIFLTLKHCLCVLRCILSTLFWNAEVKGRMNFRFFVPHFRFIVSVSRANQLN